MNKRYLLIMKSDFSNDILTKSFYTLEEAKITANVENKNGWITTWTKLYFWKKLD
ncbi:hypothetical protein [Spiroplasma citri]|uniref:Uncharacterized protein n=1 Tax=Spiroplasma citri TaxID=2133 RepID=A0AAJ4JYE6_SPICI|nr:hypothetical protein [Spiroplasma citri]APE74866.1 hypothetical protein SCITRI_00981 [Spiroplasma citri]QIA67136.1 hypothetical protein GMI18_05460 [Spiroplasma citri]QIA69043.1 hypothetical protein GL298_05700 [Spiroplasma citri]QIA70909.1 hypothetical protein GL981_05755 [Spiroplasma citri]QIA72910.1 hypothetical protein GL982_04330 [Spiroplasma citri]